MNRNWAIFGAVAAFVILVGCCVCLVVAAGAGLFITNSSQPYSINLPSILSTPTSTPVVIRPTTPAPPAAAVTGVQSPAPSASAPAATPAPPPGGPEDTLKTLEDSVVPTAELPDLVSRLQGKKDVPVTEAPPSKPFQMGDKQSFWVSNSDTNQNFQVPATLRYITTHSYFWVQDDITYNQNDLQKLADTFENKIYPTDREFFGSEWTPGVDSDPHLYILYAHDLGSTLAGYFSSADEYTPEVRKYSNGHEMFVFNADHTNLGDEYTYGVLAHEFQHMIHWYRDRNEDTWINEGFSEVATFLNGYDTGGFDIAFARHPDLQLNDWPTQEAQSPPNYGASFLFLDYFLDRFKEDATKALVGDPLNGLESVDEVLGQIGATDSLTKQPVTADSFFTDWAVTNYLHDGSVADGRFTYHNYTNAPKVPDTEKVNSCPTGVNTRDVHQYAADYIHFRCRGNFTLSFEGSVQVGVVPVQPHSGSYYFWSNKGDESDMTLTQTFDFTNHSGPLTLSYWTWYDVEKDFDYVYLVASTDGQNWQMIHTPSGTDKDPTGGNFGWGYNGESGANGSQWIHENVDISQFAGKKVQLRFEYVTDAAVNGEGFLLDDISIPQIGYASDFEKDPGGWDAKGFVRVDNILPQSFRLALITFGKKTDVQMIPVSAEETAQIPLSIGGDVSDAVLVVAGTTRFTRQEAAYRYQISPAP